MRHKFSIPDPGSLEEAVKKIEVHIAFWPGVGNAVGPSRTDAPHPRMKYMAKALGKAGIGHVTEEGIVILDIRSIFP